MTIIAHIDAAENLMSIDTEDEEIACVRLTSTGIDTAKWDKALARCGFTRIGEWTFDGGHYQPGQIGSEDGPESAECEVKRI